MALSAKQERYTFADILAWDEGENIEIISGEAFMMATPSRIHQKISMELSLWRPAVRAGWGQPKGRGYGS